MKYYFLNVDNPDKQLSLSREQILNYEARRLEFGIQYELEVQLEEENPDSVRVVRVVRLNKGDDQESQIILQQKLIIDAIKREQQAHKLKFESAELFAYAKQLSPAPDDTSPAPYDSEIGTQNTPSSGIRQNKESVRVDLENPIPPKEDALSESSPETGEQRDGAGRLSLAQRASVWATTSRASAGTLRFELGRNSRSRRRSLSVGGHLRTKPETETVEGGARLANRSSRQATTSTAAGSGMINLTQAEKNSESRRCQSSGAMFLDSNIAETESDEEENLLDIPLDRRANATRSTKRRGLFREIELPSKEKKAKLANGILGNLTRVKHVFDTANTVEAATYGLTVALIGRATLAVSTLIVPAGDSQSQELNARVVLCICLTMAKWVKLCKGPDVELDHKFVRNFISKICKIEKDRSLSRKDGVPSGNDPVSRMRRSTFLWINGSACAREAPTKLL